MTSLVDRMTQQNQTTDPQSETIPVLSPQRTTLLSLLDRIAQQSAEAAKAGEIALGNLNAAMGRIATLERELDHEKAERSKEKARHAEQTAQDRHALALAFEEEPGLPPTATGAAAYFGKVRRENAALKHEIAELKARLTGLGEDVGEYGETVHNKSAEALAVTLWGSDLDKARYLQRRGWVQNGNGGQWWSHKGQGLVDVLFDGAVKTQVKKDAETFRMLPKKWMEVPVANHDLQPA